MIFGKGEFLLSESRAGGPLSTNPGCDRWFIFQPQVIARLRRRLHPQFS
jgi:hypothetical protein